MNRGFNKKLIANIAWSFFGRFGYLLVGLIANIILARLLGPEEFGQIAIIMFFIAIANVLTESGLSGALIRKIDVVDSDYSTVFIFNLVVSLIMMMLLITSSGAISSFYNDPDLKSIIIACSFVLIINAFKINQLTKLIKELKFKDKALYEFIAILISSIIAVTMAFGGAGVWSLVAMQLMTVFVLTVLLWIFVGPPNSLAFDITVFKKLFKFGSNTTLASILEASFDNIYQLILGKYFSISQTGFYYQAKKLQEVSVGIVQLVTSNVVYSSLARLQNSPNIFNAMYQEIVNIFTVAVALICLLIFFYADSIVLFLYGEEWISTAIYLRFLIVGSFFYLQEIFNRIIFKIFDRTEKILQLEVLKKIIQSITIAYGLITMSIDNLLFGFIVTSAIAFVVNYFFARKIQNNFSWFDVFVLVKISCISIITVLTGELCKEFYDLNRFEVFLLLPLLLFVYFSLLHFSKVRDLRSDINRLHTLYKND
jgi:teichuronic acid exporter